VDDAVILLSGIDPFSIPNGLEIQESFLQAAFPNSQAHRVTKDPLIAKHFPEHG